MSKSVSSLMLSFEFFPPKTPEGKKIIMASAHQLAKVNPNFFSVTFGAGGSTREGTNETLLQLNDCGIPLAPHLASIGLTRQELIDIIKTHKKNGLRKIVALRGDLPSGMGNAGEIKYASDLVALIREITGDHFTIEVAAYPEVHPQAKSAFSDMISLKNKIDNGANSAITQYFFNADGYFYFIDSCQKQGITIPIIPGIMPIVNVDRLMHFSDLCGAEIPRWIRRRLESYGDDHESIKQFGREVVSNLCAQLLNQGVPGLHFYTLNQAEPSLHLIKLLNIKPGMN